MVYKGHHGLVIKSDKTAFQVQSNQHKRINKQRLDGKIYAQICNLSTIMQDV